MYVLTVCKSWTNSREIQFPFSDQWTVSKRRTWPYTTVMYVRRSRCGPRSGRSSSIESCHGYPLLKDPTESATLFIVAKLQIDEIWRTYECFQFRDPDDLPHFFALAQIYRTELTQTRRVRRLMISVRFTDHRHFIFIILRGAVARKDARWFSYLKSWFFVSSLESHARKRMQGQQTQTNTLLLTEFWRSCEGIWSIKDNILPNGAKSSVGQKVSYIPNVMSRELEQTRWRMVLGNTNFWELIKRKFKRYGWYETILMNIFEICFGTCQIYG